MKIDFVGPIFILVLFCFFSNILSPFILLGANYLFYTNEVSLQLGNPKAIYLYDICSTCSNPDKDNIISSLNKLETESGIRFIQLPEPFALILGGIEYSCEDVTIIDAVGESENGYFGISFFIFVWNVIRLDDTDSGIVLHETLHSLGFDHTNNKDSIMYPFYTSQCCIDQNIISFLKTFYIYNPLAYANILSLNMILISGALLILLSSLWVISMYIESLTIHK